MADCPRSACAICRPMLEVDDLSKTYGETVALDGASISVRARDDSRDPRREWLRQEHAGQAPVRRVSPPSRGAIRVDGPDDRSLLSGGVPSARPCDRLSGSPDRSRPKRSGQHLPWLRRSAPAPRRARDKRSVAAETLRHDCDNDSSISTRPPVSCLSPRSSSSCWRALWSDARAFSFSTKSPPRSTSPIASRVSDHGGAFARGGGLILFISHRMDEVLRLARPRHHPAQRPGGGHARPRVSVRPSKCCA